MEHTGNNTQPTFSSGGEISAEYKKRNERKQDEGMDGAVK